MGPKMSLQHTNSRIGLRAIFVGALERLIPGVSCHVRAEIAKGNKTFFTIFPFASKWSLSSLHLKKVYMNSNVSDQISFFCEFLFASLLRTIEENSNFNN